jgi:hypothetical protein
MTWIRTPKNGGMPFLSDDSRRRHEHKSLRLAELRGIIDLFHSLGARHPWQWWCTVTFRKKLSAEAADKEFKKFLRRLLKAAFPGPMRRRGANLLVFRFIIYSSEIGGRLHYHFFIGNLPPFLVNNPKLWEKKWRTTRGMACFKHYDPTKMAEEYALNDAYHSRHHEYWPRMMDSDRFDIPAYPRGIGTLCRGARKRDGYMN